MCGKWVQMAWASSSCLAVKVRSASFKSDGAYVAIELFFYEFHFGWCPGDA
jgi:hypothetical protein